MTFVNEFIPPEDVERFHLDEVDKRFFIGIQADDWTIDRERNIYLRKIASGGGSDPDLSNRSKWTLYWKGNLLVLGMEYLEGGGERGQPGWSHWKLTWIELPEHLKSYQEAILDDLKEALLAYKDGGIYSKNTSYKVTLDKADSLFRDYLDN
jgi:hypothetical protein